MIQVTEELLTNANILIVDDFQGMRTMFRNIVKEMGVARIDTASNGKEALNLLRVTKYDVVLCDFNLGAGLNGQQLLEEARASKYIGLATIWIIVTAEKTSEMVLGAAEVKPDDYLLKPINQALLESRLERLISKKRSLAKIEEAIEVDDYIGAIALCDQRLKDEPSQPNDILRIKSNLLLTIGAYDGARSVFDSVLAARSMPWAKTGLGKIFFYTKDYEGAKVIFQEVLEENRMYMEASDWLAKTLEAMGEGKQAQQVLLDAAKLSPNSASRQKSLADSAYRNGELDVAQSAYQKSIKISEFSSNKSPAIFSGLAKVFSEQGASDDAMKVLDQSRKEFVNNPEATVQIAATESVVYHKAGKKEKAEASMLEAEQLMDKLSGKVSTDVAMEMAKSYFKLGKKDKASEMLGSIVKNNHESADISREVEAIFESEGMKEEGQALVNQSREEVINLNNQGVMLAKAGKFDEGAELLRKSLENLPNNEVIMMNLSGLLLGQMTRQGKNDLVAAEVRTLLDRVQRLNPANKKMHEYVAVLNRITNGK